MVSEPKPKLLVVELWGLGDLVIATPFLEAACQKYAVTLLAKPYALDLRPRLWPEVQVVPFVAPWTAFLHKYRLFRWPWREFLHLRRLGLHPFEVGLSARWDPRDHLLLCILRAKRRLGFSRMGSRMFLTNPLTRPDLVSHRFENWRVLAEALGLEIPAPANLGAAAIPQRESILVHTGAGQSIRVWPLDHYRKLVERLRREHYRVQVACDPDQEKWWSAAGETGVVSPRTVTELIGLIDRAGIFIGNDSGPGHLAAHFGVPTFTIFGPQLPSCFTPLHPQAEWIEGKPCPYKPCYDYCQFAAPHCLWDLGLEDVWTRVDKFVQRHRAALTVADASPVPSLGYHTTAKRKFIQVFCRYMMRGGEENSVARIASHLELSGHEVFRFWRASEEWTGKEKPNLVRQMVLAWKNQSVLGRLREMNRRVQPDAWIFHNIIPVVSFGAYGLARELNVPVVQWIHNYRPISPSGTLCAGGQMLDPRDPWRVWKEIRHATWHGHLGTAGLALAYARLHQHGDFESVKAWVAVSEEMRQIFLRAGYPENRFFCLHHSWDIRPPIDLNLDEGYFLFLGRMVEEKGVRFLMNLWQRPELKGLKLVMAGEGELADEYRGKTSANIQWVGFVQGAEKRRLLAGCRALLFPCLWAEPLTTVVYEAYEQGKPVLASALGGLKELVVDRDTGRMLPPGDIAAWTQAVLEQAQNPGLSRERGHHGLTWLNTRVSPAAWNRQFDEIMARALPALPPRSLT